MGRPGRQENALGERRAVCLAGERVRRDGARPPATAGTRAASAAHRSADLGEAQPAELDRALARAAEHARGAYRTSEPWDDRIRGALAALLELFDEEPRLARLCMMQLSVVGSAEDIRRRSAFAALTRVLDEGRDCCRDSPPPFAAEGVLAGTIGAIHGRLVQPQSEPLIELLKPLMSFIVLPYRGAVAARGELTRPGPAAPSRAQPAG